MHEDIYLTGLGLAGENDFMESAAACMPPLPGAGAAKPVTELLPGLNLRRISRIGRLALQASAQALAFGGQPLPLDGQAAERTGLFVGTALGASGHSFAFLDSVLEGGARLASPTQFSQSVTNVLSGALSMFLNTQGPINTICQYGQSFAGAWQCGVSAIGSGEADHVLVGAVEERCLHVEELLGRGGRGTRFRAPEHTVAVFFRLSRAAVGALARVADTRWNFGSDADGAAKADHDFYLGNSDCRDSAPDVRFYAGHPAEQALDVAAALGLLAAHGRGAFADVSGRASAACVYSDPDRPSRSEIILETA